MEFSMFCRFAGLLSAAVLLLLPIRVQADDLPKFSDADVNQFVSQYAEFANNYAQAYQAAKKGNTSALDQLKTQVQQLEDKVSKVAEKLKLNPAEVQKYERFITMYTEKMIDATK